MPSSPAACSPGIVRASILSRASLIWLRISATRTSIRHLCTSPLRRICFSKPASDFVCGAPNSCMPCQKEETYEAKPVSPVAACLLPRMVGATTQRFPSHGVVLPGQLAAVFALRRCAENEVRCQTRHGRSHGSRGSRVSERRRTGSQVLDRNAQLSIGGAAQLL